MRLPTLRIIGSVIWRAPRFLVEQIASLWFVPMKNPHQQQMFLPAAEGKEFDGAAQDGITDDAGGNRRLLRSDGIA